jgi:hypothetical protein
VSTALASTFFLLLSLGVYATREALVSHSGAGAKTLRHARMPRAYPTPALRLVTSAFKKRTTHNA